MGSSLVLLNKHTKDLITIEAQGRFDPYTCYNKLNEKHLLMLRFSFSNLQIFHEKQKTLTLTYFLIS